MIDEKEEKARDVAENIVDFEDTDVSDVSDWPKWDVYEWIEAWGYCWSEEDREWHYETT